MKPNATRSTAIGEPALVTRRGALGRILVAGAAAGGLVAPRGTLQAMEPVPAHIALPPILAPADALRELENGNERFVAGRTIGPNRNLARAKDVASKQAPFAAVLSCADSRVPVEILYDQGIGDLFVCRVAGNLVTPELLASLEFGTLVLGAKALLVLGHTSCGAVSATIQAKAVPGQISVLYRHIHPAVERAGSAGVEAVARENVRMQVRLLTGSSPVIAELLKEGRLVVMGGIYDLTTGRVTLLDS